MDRLDVALVMRMQADRAELAAGAIVGAQPHLAQSPGFGLGYQAGLASAYRTAANMIEER